MVEIHGYIDFDGTLTTSYSHFKLHLMGAGTDLIKKISLMENHFLEINKMNYCIKIIQGLLEFK